MEELNLDDVFGVMEGRGMWTNKDYPLDSLQHKETETPEGCKVVYRKRNQLQLDIDGPLDLETLDKRLDMLSQAGLRIEQVDRWESRSGNTHVVVTLVDDLDNHEAILLQQFLGSDPVREFMSYARVANGIPSPILLYKPNTSKRVVIR